MKRPQGSALTGDPNTRQYLDGRDIHCGDVLELEAREWADAIFEFVPTGKWVPVRYEIEWNRERDGRTVKTPTMHAQVGGYGFTAPITERHRFRWPGGDS